MPHPAPRSSAEDDDPWHILGAKIPWGPGLWPPKKTQLEFSKDCSEGFQRKGFGCAWNTATCRPGKYWKLQQKSHWNAPTLVSWQVQVQHQDHRQTQVEPGSTICVTVFWCCFLTNEISHGYPHRVSRTWMFWGCHIPSSKMSNLWSCQGFQKDESSSHRIQTFNLIWSYFLQVIVFYIIWSSWLINLPPWHTFPPEIKTLRAD